MIETLVCPNCSSAIRSAKTHELPDSKTATCKQCAMKFTLGQARELGKSSAIPVPPPAPIAPTVPPTPAMPAQQTIQHVYVHHSAPRRSKTVALLLWFFLGGLGVHQFYLGRPVFGILYLFSFVMVFLTFFLWLIVHVIVLLVDGIILMCKSESELQS